MLVLVPAGVTVPDGEAVGEPVELRVANAVIDTVPVPLYPAPFEKVVDGLVLPVAVRDPVRVPEGETVDVPLTPAVPVDETVCVKEPVAVKEAVTVGV